MANSKTNSKNNVKCMDPIVGKNPQILILGTMPGKTSLDIGEYYAAHNNCFWKLIEHIYNNGKPLATYDKKLKCLKDNKIALWDIFEYCERKSSLDKDIKKEIFNDLAQFLKNHPTITKVLCNGKTAWSAFKRLKIPIEFYKMSSTSNAYPLAFDKKLKEWKTILTEKIVTYKK